MKQENAIEVRNIVKKFRVYMDRGRTIKELTLFSKRRKYEESLVLNDISFEVKKGEAIGLIGKNGCGKSTTLKLLTRIMYPDSGSIEMQGRVSSLIELGAGFHPDMTGRQNIFTNASIFGLTRKEIENRIQDIIDFSELGDAIDTPVRTYSSGMYMRLAFSVAINVDADILLIDEILAVGDATFQAKCFEKLREIKKNGTTIVIVSHSTAQIEQICDRSIWIQDGKIKAQGIPRMIHMQYLDFMGQSRQESLELQNQKAKEEMVKQAEEISTNEEMENKSEEEEQKNESEPSSKERWGNGNARFVDIQAFDALGKRKEVFKTGESCKFMLSYKVSKKISDAVFGIGIFKSDGIQCYGTNTKIEGMNEFDLEKDGVVELLIDNLILLPGTYDIDFAIVTMQGLPIDYYTKAYKLEIYSELNEVGICRIGHSWKLNIKR